MKKVYDHKATYETYMDIFKDTVRDFSYKENKCR